VWLETQRPLRRPVNARPPTVIIPSRHVAATAMGWGVPEQRIRVIPNPAPEIDASVDRDELRRRLGVEGPTFAFAGRLVPAKNIPLLIAALRSVPGCELVMVGDGPERENVESAIAAAGVGERVRMTGALPRADTLQWLRAADAAVLPSDRENFPHMAVEALAAGAPVIGTAVGGVPEIITSGVDGLLVERRDEDGLAAAMRSVIDDPGLLARLRAGALQSAARYSREHLYSEIEDVLEAAVASTSSVTASA
jgi:glycosyltransferase involved in cell wall biosynthesis